MISFYPDEVSAGTKEVIRDYILVQASFKERTFPSNILPKFSLWVDGRWKQIVDGFWEKGASLYVGNKKDLNMPVPLEAPGFLTALSHAVGVNEVPEVRQAIADMRAAIIAGMEGPLKRQSMAAMHNGQAVRYLAINQKEGLIAGRGINPDGSLTPWMLQTGERVDPDSQKDWVTLMA